MATGGPSATKGKEEDFRHTCSLCMEPYRGRSPKLLPCYHTFCLPCLTALEASVRSAKRDTATDDDLGQKEAQKEQLAQAKNDDEDSEAQPREELEGTTSANDGTMGDDVTTSQDDVDTACFLCPTCRSPVPIPEGGVTALQTNFYVDHEVGPDEDLPSVLCDMCEEDNRQHATHACQECHMNMCRSCRRHHDMVGRDHHVTPVGLSQPVKEKREKRGLCLVHQDQILCFYCRQCDVSICLHCKVTSHEGHETVDLASAALQAREEITSLIPTAQQQLQVMDMSIQQVDREDRDLTRHVQEVTQQIRERRDVLMTWARQSHDQLMEEVSVKEASARSQLHTQKASSTLTRDTLSMVLSRAARATAADLDVVMWRKELKAALLTEDKLDQHKQQADSQGHSWGCRYDVTDASVMHEDDVRAYMGRVVEGTDAEVSRVPVSLRELTDRVERWMKEVTENTSILTSQLSSITDDVTQLQKKGDELEKKTDKLEKKEDELEKKGDELQKKGDKLQKKADKLQKKGDELEKTTASLQNEITASRKTEADLEKVTMSLYETSGKAREVFRVRGVDRDKTKQNQAMIFRTVDSNEGGQYNIQTGVFTAPQTGLYGFTAGVCCHGPGVTVYGQIMVGDDKHCAVQSGHGGGGSQSVLVPLTAGQKVWLRANSPGDLYDGLFFASYFSGTCHLALT